MRLKTILAIVLFFALFISCNKEERLSYDKKEEAIVVPISLNGVEMSVYQEPMTKATVPVVYFINVTQDSKPYAYYCMTSFDDVSISLLDGHKYDFTAYVAYDVTGSFYWMGTVGSGISVKHNSLTDGFEYTSEKYLNFNGIRDYDYKMLVGKASYTSLPSSISLDLYNAFFGLKVNATNLKGTLSLDISGYTSYSGPITITKDNPSIVKYIHFMNPLDVISSAIDGTEYSNDIDITIKYTNESGDVSVLHNGSIKVSRLKYTILNIKMSDNAGPLQSVSFSLENSTIIDGNTIDLEF